MEKIQLYLQYGLDIETFYDRLSEAVNQLHSHNKTRGHAIAPSSPILKTKRASKA